MAEESLGGNIIDLHLQILEFMKPHELIASERILDDEIAETEEHIDRLTEILRKSLAVLIKKSEAHGLSQTTISRLLALENYRHERITLMHISCEAHAGVRILLPARGKRTSLMMPSRCLP